MSSEQHPVVVRIKLNPDGRELGWRAVWAWLLDDSAKQSSARESSNCCNDDSGSDKDEAKS